MEANLLFCKKNPASASCFDLPERGRTLLIHYNQFLLYFDRASSYFLPTAFQSKTDQNASR